MNGKKNTKLNYKGVYMSQQENWKDKISSAVKQYPIMVYMRGTSAQPHCGFSARVVRALKELNKKEGVDFATEDMDADPMLWSALKELNDWPTSPQIYVNGEFIGGCDIFIDMVKNGEIH